MFVKLFIAALCCSAVLVQCSAYRTSRIVGGAEAADKQFPYQISMTKYGVHNCGGSILNENYILTAAHCVRDTFTLIYRVVAGSNNLEKGGVERRIKRIISHKDFGVQAHWNDIALVELTEPLPFNDYIQPIEIDTEVVPAGASVVVSGWGLIAKGGPDTDNLRFNTLKTITPEECKSEIGADYDGLMCLAHDYNNGICFGDSGGPAMYNGKLVGVASYVYWGECGSNKPDGYTRVSYYVDWINANMNGE